jgi:prepilin-type N-terminal cleavage/methylation domain-containing protein
VIHSVRGLTLVELLVVVFILAAIAATAVSFVDNADQQTRYDDTKTRLAAIRAAVAGRPDRSVNGEPDVAGFVADMGRLPASMQELLERGALPPFSAASDAGWRGPYLTPLPDRDGVLRYTDGFGNPWTTFDAAGGRLVVQSAGGTAAPYDVEYPKDGVALVEPADWRLDFLAGRTVTVVFSDAGNDGADLTGVPVCLRLYCPEEGALAWPSPYASAPVAVTVANGDAEERVDFTFPASTPPVPIGVRALGVVAAADGTAVGADRRRRVVVAPRGPAPDLTQPLPWPLE